MAASSVGASAASSRKYLFPEIARRNFSSDQTLASFDIIHHVAEAPKGSLGKVGQVFIEADIVAIAEAGLQLLQPFDG